MARRPGSEITKQLQAITLPPPSMTGIMFCHCVLDFGTATLKKIHQCSPSANDGSIHKHQHHFLHLKSLFLPLHLYNCQTNLTFLT